jgi:hypothetical protein
MLRFEHGGLSCGTAKHRRPVLVCCCLSQLPHSANFTAADEVVDCCHSLAHCRWAVWPGQPSNPSSRLWRGIVWIAFCIHSHACSLWRRCSKQLAQPQYQQGQERQEALSRTGAADVAAPHCMVFVPAAAHWRAWDDCMHGARWKLQTGGCYSICMGSMWLAAGELNVHACDVHSRVKQI